MKKRRFLHVWLLQRMTLYQKYYQSFIRNQEWVKIELQKKVHRRGCVRDITFLTARPPCFLCHFFLLNGPKKDTYCYVWYSAWYRKYEILLQFNTSSLASLGTWYYLRLFSSFNCSAYDLTLIIKSHILNYYLLLLKFLKNKNLQTRCWWLW